MRATLRGGLSHAMSMPGLWGHDIGGFFGPELTPELCVRWTQFGALSPLMRAHGLRPREPWAFGDRALAIARDWIRLCYSLLPYLWQTAKACAQRGWPMMRPLLPRVEVGEGVRNTGDLLDAPWVLHAFGEVPATATFVDLRSRPFTVTVDGERLITEGSSVPVSLVRHNY